MALRQLNSTLGWPILMKAEYLIKCWIVFLAWLFALASFSKLIDISTFQESLLTLYPFSSAVLPVVGLLVPICELLISYLLLTRRFAGLFLSLALLVTMTIIVQFALSGGNEVSCGCFGVYSPISQTSFLTRNLTLILLTYLAFLYSARNRIDSVSVRK